MRVKGDQKQQSQEEGLQRLVREQQEKFDWLEDETRLQEERIHWQEEKLALYHKQAEGLAVLREQVEELGSQAQNLQGCLRKNCHNRHLLPSSDRFTRKTRNLRKKGKKKVEGQLSYEGRTQELAENLDQVVVHEVEHCEYCQANLGEVRSVEEVVFQARYLTNLPDPFLDHPQKGGWSKQSQARNLLDCLSKHRNAVLCFLDDFSVSFDSNLAEQNLPVIKVRQKIPGHFHILAEAFCRVHSYLSTLCKQSLHLLTALETALIRWSFSPLLSRPPTRQLPKLFLKKKDGAILILY